MLIGLASVKGSPGVTSAALALIAVWPRPAVLLEADPAGGDLTYRCRAAHGGPVYASKGLLTLAAAVRGGLPAHGGVHVAGVGDAPGREPQRADREFAQPCGRPGWAGPRRPRRACSRGLRGPRRDALAGWSSGAADPAHAVRPAGTGTARAGREGDRPAGPDPAAACGPGGRRFDGRTRGGGRMRVDPDLLRTVHREVGDRLQREQVARRGQGRAPLTGLGEQQ